MITIAAWITLIVIVLFIAVMGLTRGRRRGSGEAGDDPGSGHHGPHGGHSGHHGSGGGHHGGGFSGGGHHG